jgi:hypothetical protein
MTKRSWFQIIGFISIMGILLGLAIRTEKTDIPQDIVNLPIYTVFTIEIEPKEGMMALLENKALKTCITLEKKASEVLYKCKGEASIWIDSLIVKKNTNRVTPPDDPEYWRWETYHTSVMLRERLKEKGLL